MKLPNIIDFSKSSAIITGGAGLLGRTYAGALLETGAQVIIIDKKINSKKIIKLIKRESKLEQKKINNLILTECDITNPEEIKNAFDKIKKYLKNIKILVNNASLIKQVGNEELSETYKSFLQMEPKDWEEYFSVDLTGTLLMCQQVIPYMKKNGGGSIINISSTYGILSPDQRLYKFFNDKLSSKMKKMGIKIEKPIGYSISKSGTLNLTRFLATKFASDNIRVNTMTLGGVFHNNPKEFVKAYSEKTPLNRMAEKQEYVGPLLFLASDMSSYMTGSNLIVDGGWSAW